MNRRELGQSIVEILLAMGLMTILIPSLLTAFVASREGRPQRNNRLEATTYLKEAAEAVRSIRESDWDAFMNYSDGTPFYPQISGNAWVLTPGVETIGTNFSRQIIIEDVQRDTTGDIVTTGGIDDPSTKHVTITVSWEIPIPSSVSTQFYLTRYIGNTAWNQTSESDLSSGVFTSTETKNDNGGEVVLQASSGGSWVNPVITDVYDNGGPADALDVFIDGSYAYIVTSNNGGNADLDIVDVSDPYSISAAGTLDLGTDVYGVHVIGDYAFLATGNTSEELMIVDISDKSSPIKVAQTDLTGNRGALCIYVSGNYAYIGKTSGNGNSNRELYVVDISNPLVPSETGMLEIGADVNDLLVESGYAYLATDNNNFELSVVDINNPDSPVGIGGYDTPGNSNAEGISALGSTVYLTTAANNSGNELYILNVSTPSSPQLLGSYDVTGTTNGGFVSGDYLFLATEVIGKELLILDVSSTSNPIEYGFLDLTVDANDLVVAGDYAYLATDGNTEELIVVEGGFGGGSGYVTSGMYESQTFDAGNIVAFNSVAFNGSRPSGTSINLQIAIGNNDPPVAYIGPDNTGNTYYNSAGAVPLENILGRYIRFKFYLTGDGGDTPVLEDFAVNYSP